MRKEQIKKKIAEKKTSNEISFLSLKKKKIS